MENNVKKEKDFYQVSLKMFLKNDKKEILALKAIDGGSLSGYYDLPGGRIDTDEFGTPFKEILQREVKEKIGDIKFNLQEKPVAVGRHLILASVSSLKRDVHILNIFFDAEYLGGEIKISNEHTAYKWLNLNEIKLSEYFTSGILDGVQMYRSLL